MFGNDCADAAKIDINEQQAERRRIRERINAGLKTETEKLVVTAPKCKTELAISCVVLVLRLISTGFLASTVTFLASLRG